MDQTTQIAFLRILEELDWPPIYLVHPVQFKKLEGDTVNSQTWGYAASYYPVITTLPNMDQKIMENILYHEVAHHLFPSKRHWWIDLYGEIMAGGGGRGDWAKKYDKTPGKHMPTRRRLVELSRRASQRLKQRYKVIR